MAVRSAREAAYETIRSRIITMELKPGDELNDHELAQELGISRTPMREALIMLNIAHMVTIKPQSGTYVAPIDLELCGMEGHFDHMLSTFQHIERLRKFSLQTDENKSVCGAHTRILEAVLHGTEEDVSRALSEHLHRYKLSVDQARAAHPDYFIGNGDTW